MPSRFQPESCEASPVRGHLAELPHHDGGETAGIACRIWMAILLLLAIRLANAQEALQNLRAADAAEIARNRALGSEPYTIKRGDFRLLATSTLGLNWNDNLHTSRVSGQEDVIVRPQVHLDLSQRVTTDNELNLSVGAGYDWYLDHSELSTWRLESGSALSFDVFVKDVWINLHDRFSYARDPAREAAIAGSSDYGIFQNAAGALVTWNLGDVTLSLGYDHVNVISLANQYRYQNHGTESIVSRAGFKLHPTVVAGLEASAAFTAYDQLFLNDNAAYSLGVYAEWQPGSYIQIQPHAGYTVYQFDNHSPFLQTSDLHTWYADLTLAHSVSDAITYRLSAGHEVRLGIQSDAIEDWYVRPSVNWRFLSAMSLTGSLSYENGRRGAGNRAGNPIENYDWYGGSLGLNYSFMKRFTARLNYRLTLRSSDVADRDYTQNLVGLELAYRVP